MKFEKVLPALRAGKKARRKEWKGPSSMCGLALEDRYINSECAVMTRDLYADDWEVLPESKRVADYWCPAFRALQDPADGMYRQAAYRGTYEVGKQPADAVLIPGTTQEVTVKEVEE